ncbi:MAG: type II toxin-antitoxin system VapC family toxin [Anaerolineae bacterium]|nr:type II toxin-antitoxin system VapC family toxin [Anaerolineae bacterium]
MTGVIADTHAVIWYLLDSPRLSAQALAQFEACRTDGVRVGVASISIVEIVYLVDKGRIPVETIPLLEESLEQRPLLEIVPLTQSIALAVRQVPREQVPDLPDRVIAATALYLGVPLISRDRKIRLSDVTTIW